MVWSIINYGAAVWGCKTFSCVAAIQSRALRFFLGVGRYAPNAAVNGDTGWDDVRVKQLSAVINQWYRLKSMERSRWNNKIYSWSVEMGSEGKKNWAYRVKHVLQDADMGEYFSMDSNNELFNKNRIKRQLASFYVEKTKTEWNENVNRVEARNGTGRNKLRTYRRFKNEYKREKYVDVILPRHHRSAYAKFRSGVAPLRLETGRYERIEERDRVCFNCDSQIEI